MCSPDNLPNHTASMGFRHARRAVGLMTLKRYVVEAESSELEPRLESLFGVVRVDALFNAIALSNLVTVRDKRLLLWRHLTRLEKRRLARSFSDWQTSKHKALNWV